jgi:T5SS/PEP-CTERM-associated repeat protein
VLSMPAAFGAYTNWTVGTGSWFVDTNWDHNQPDSTTDAFINNGGTALVTDDQANAVALSLTLGQYASDSGTVSVSPPHAGMNVTGTIFVGYRGSGSLIINSPGGVASAGASIASLTTGAVVSNGAATVDGANSTWTVSGEADVGGTTSGAGGTGLLTVTNRWPAMRRLAPSTERPSMARLRQITVQCYSTGPVNHTPGQRFRASVSWRTSVSNHGR